jgi:DUF971 family protein
VGRSGFPGSDPIALISNLAKVLNLRKVPGEYMNEKPTGITANKKNRELTVTWNDGHTSVYPFGLLRAACPCASCRGGHENMGSEPDPNVFGIELEEGPSTRLANIQAVGSYAMSIVWEDGHDYGIFNWHYLRALCPCVECRSKG